MHHGVASMTHGPPLPSQKRPSQQHAAAPGSGLPSNSPPLGPSTTGAPPPSLLAMLSNPAAYMRHMQQQQQQQIQPQTMLPYDRPDAAHTSTTSTPSASRPLAAAAATPPSASFSGATSTPFGQPPSGMKTADFLRERIKLAEESLRKMATNGPPGAASHALAGSVPAVGGAASATRPYSSPSQPHELASSAPAHSQYTSQSAYPASVAVPHSNGSLNHPSSAHSAAPATAAAPAPADASIYFGSNDSDDSEEEDDTTASEDDPETEALLVEVEQARLRREQAEFDLAQAEASEAAEHAVAEQARQDEMNFRRQRMERDAAALAELDAQRDAALLEDDEEQSPSQQPQHPHDPSSDDLEQPSYTSTRTSITSTGSAGTPDIALIMRVSMDHGQVDLAVPRGADPLQLALEFCSAQGLDRDKVSSLALSIEQHLEMLATNEKEQAETERRRAQEQQEAETREQQRQQQQRQRSSLPSSVSKSRRADAVTSESMDDDSLPPTARQEESMTSRTNDTSTLSDPPPTARKSRPTSTTRRDQHDAAAAASRRRSRSRSTSTTRDRSRDGSSSARGPRALDPSSASSIPFVNRRSLELLQRSAERARSVDRTTAPPPRSTPRSAGPKRRSASQSRAPSSRDRSVSKERVRDNDNDGSQSARSSAGAPYTGSYASQVASTPFHERLHAEAAARRRHLESLRDAREEEVLVLQRTKKVLNKSRELAGHRMIDTNKRPGERLYEDGLKLRAAREQAHVAALVEREEAELLTARSFPFQPVISEFAHNIRREGDHNYERILDSNGAESSARKAKARAAKDAKLQAELESPGSFTPELNERSQALAAKRAKKEAEERATLWKDMARARGLVPPSEEDKADGEESKQMVVATPLAPHDRLHAESEVASRKRALLQAQQPTPSFKPKIHASPSSSSASAPTQPFPPAGPFDTPRRVEAIYAEACERQRRVHLTGVFPLMPPSGAWSMQPDGSARWVPVDDDGGLDSDSNDHEAPPPTLSARRFQRAKDVFGVLDVARSGVLDASCMERVSSLHPADQHVIFGLLRRLGDAQRVDRARQRANESGVSLERALASLTAQEVREGGTPPPLFALLFSDFLHLFRFELALRLKNAQTNYDLLTREAGDLAELQLHPDARYAGGQYTASRAQSRRGSFNADQALVPVSAPRRGRSRGPSSSSHTVSRAASRSTSRRASVERERSTSLGRLAADDLEHSFAQAMQLQQQQQNQLFASQPPQQPQPQPHHRHQAPPSSAPPLPSYPPQMQPPPPPGSAPSSSPYTSHYHRSHAEIEREFGHESPALKAERLRLAYEHQLAENEQRRHEEWLRHQQWMHESATTYERQLREKHEAEMALEAARIQRAREEAQRGRPKQVLTHAESGAIASSSSSAPPASASTGPPSLMALANMDLTGGSSSSTTGGDSSASSSQELASRKLPDSTTTPSPPPHIEPEAQPAASSVAPSSAPSPTAAQTPLSALQQLALESPRARSALTRLPSPPYTLPRSHYPPHSFKPEVSPRSEELASKVRQRYAGQDLHHVLHRQALERRHTNEYRIQAKQINDTLAHQKEFASPYNRS